MRKFFIGGLLLAAATVASATTTYNVVASGSSTAGNIIKAEADFTFATNLLTLTLTNLLVNPTSVGQNITDLQFKIASATGGGTISSAIAPRTVSVAGNGTPTLGGPVNPVQWSFTPSAGGVFTLEGLGVPGAPAYTIIGAPDASNMYSNANGSIAGNGPPNPFIYETATWVFNIAGVTDATTSPTNIIFSFGTQGGALNYYSCDSSGCYAPEPGSWLLLGTGLAGLIFFARKAARKRPS
jgi:hypothetical protein